MSFRITFGSRWLEVYLFSKLMLGGLDILFVQYGHNSTRNLIRVVRSHRGTVALRLGSKRPRIIFRGGPDGTTRA